MTRLAALHRYNLVPQNVFRLPHAGGESAPRTPLEAMATPAAIPAANCEPGTAEESEAIARRWTEEALDTHNLDILDEIVAADMVHHAGILKDEGGRDALKSDLTALLTAFPDAPFTADIVVATPDRAAVHWTGRGTHLGLQQNLQPTGKPVVFTGINVYRLACGQIVEGWSEPDSLGLLQQLDVVPEMPLGAASPTS
jgi:predicted ester cyclase